MRPAIIRQALTISALIVLTLNSMMHAQDWLSIRGPNFDGSASIDDTELASGPLQLKVVWRQPTGSGYSGIVKSGDRLVSATSDAISDVEYVVALSAATGETLWKTATGKMMKGANGSFDGPVATPAADHKRAYHLSPFGRLAAYSLDDGSVVWQHELAEEYLAPPNFYGFGASPIVYDGVLIVPVGSPNAAVMGFDTQSGKVLWKAGKDGAAFHSPVPIKIRNETMIVVAGNTTLFAINPTNGHVQWSKPHGGASGENVMSIIPVPLSAGGVFVNDQRDGSTRFNVSVDGATSCWSGRDIRNTYCVPVMSGGLLCSYSSRFLVALNPETGKQVWRSRSPSNGFLGTVAGRLVVATMDGSLHIGDVSKNGFAEVAKAEIFSASEENAESGLMWSLPTIGGRSVYLRSLGGIARVDIEPGTDKSLVTSEQAELAPGFATFVQKVESSSGKQKVINDYLNGKSMPLIEGDFVHFVLQGKYKDVAVAGELFGMRQERLMKRIDGTDLFYFGARIPGSTRLAYVFFADYQPTLDPLNSRKVASTIVTGEMEPNFIMPSKPLALSWFDKGDIAKDIPANFDSPSAKLAGTLNEAQLDSVELKEKVGLSVYLPPGYSDSKVSYPVVFVHDGKVAIESGNQAAIIDSLIGAQKVRPAIVVFIDKRFFPLQGANGYPEFFAKELIPKITRDYRASTSRNDRACLSGGFGATLALMATLPASDQISRIGCHSPFALEMMHPIIGSLAKMPGERCKVFVQWSKYDFRNPSENWNMAAQAETVAKILSESGHSVTTATTGTGSDWVCWRTQSEMMWQFLLGK